MADGARLLVVAARLGALPLEDDEGRAVASAEAILDHVTDRLRNLQRAVRGSLDPAVIWTEANAALPKSAGGDPDVRLEEWSPAKRLEQAQRDAVRTGKTAAQQHRRRRSR